jgi:hypothetical protein
MSTPLTDLHKNATCTDVIAALCATLNELSEALAALGGDSYTKPNGHAFGNSTISMHVRHILDHVRALIHANDQDIDDTPLDYDTRHRGTDIETCLDAAQAEIAHLCAKCDSLKAQRVIRL